MHLIKTGIVSVFFLSSHNLFSQSLVTDRPDQTESAVTVPLKSLQIETGVTYESLRANSATIKNYSIAGTLVRYGLIDFLELRFGGAYLITKSESTLNGFGNILTGLKINFAKEDKNFVNLAILANAFLPVGSETFKPQNVDPQLIAAVSKSISERFSFSINIGGLYSSTIEELIYRYTASVGITLADALTLFVETYGDFNSSSSAVHNFDAGFTFLISDDLQIDISGGKGISGTDSFWFIGTGVSIRVNNL